MKKLSAKQASRWALGLDREQAAVLAKILLDERNESERRKRTMTYKEKFELLYDEIMKDFENVTDEKPQEMLKAVRYVVQKAYELDEEPEEAWEAERWNQEHAEA